MQTTRVGVDSVYVRESEGGERVVTVDQDEVSTCNTKIDIRKSLRTTSECMTHVNESKYMWVWGIV